MATAGVGDAGVGDAGLGTAIVGIGEAVSCGATSTVEEGGKVAAGGFMSLEVAVVAGTGADMGASGAGCSAVA